MSRFRHISSRFGLPLLTLGAVLTVMCGCIFEDRSDCPPPEVDITEEVLIVKAFDAGDGSDITITDRIVDGSLFIFDSNKKILNYIGVPKSELGVEKVIPLYASTRAKLGDTIYVSAWGNIEGNLHVLGEYFIGEDMYAPFLTLLPNAEDQDYCLCPGEMFFGMHEIILGQPDEDATVDEAGKMVHTVHVTQINARLNVTVRGLPAGADASDYYFRLCKQNNGYDFAGNSVNNDISEILEDGVFNAAGDLVSEEPYYLIPSMDESNIDENSAMVLHLLQKSPTRVSENDIDLTGVISKVDYGDGDYIGLYSGKTTNVLIKYLPDGSYEVGIKITDWDEIYQWTVW